MDREQGRLWACVAGSAAVHALALALIALGSAGQSGQDGGQDGAAAERRGPGSRQGEFTSAMQPVQVRLRPLPTDESGRPPPAPAIARDQGAGGACEPGDQSYEGIGISYSNFTGEVRRAPPDYPAYQAGVREGDVVENVGAQPEGGYLTLAIVRGAHRHWLRVKAKTICYTPGQDELPAKAPSRRRRRGRPTIGAYSEAVNLPADKASSPSCR